ncbi:hypothetical protein COO60DRAFT_144691 [Scenedesmus sp. NREL 46B-D3]|nr:hypothetical protein COO60DRAFT_144691 [Scenedesmus sp. NREL 46B-D3]
MPTDREQYTPVLCSAVGAHASADTSCRAPLLLVGCTSGQKHTSRQRIPETSATHAPKALASTSNACSFPSYTLQLQNQSTHGQAPCCAGHTARSNSSCDVQPYIADMEVSGTVGRHRTLFECMSCTIIMSSNDMQLMHSQQACINSHHPTSRYHAMDDHFHQSMCTLIKQSRPPQVMSPQLCYTLELLCNTAAAVLLIHTFAAACAENNIAYVNSFARRSNAA